MPNPIIVVEEATQEAIDGKDDNAEPEASDLDTESEVELPLLGDEAFQGKSIFILER